MIKDISNIKTKPIDWIESFLQECIVEEKIDAHYATVDIVSTNAIKIKKANGKEIDRVDMILNSMWNNLFFDWNYLLLTNKNWFNSHIGFSISMFYLPCSKPINIEYPEKLRYVIDRVTLNGESINLSVMKQFLNDCMIPDTYEIKIKEPLTKASKEEIGRLFEEYKKDKDIEKCIKSLISLDKILALDNNYEGLVIRHKKHIYQYQKFIKPESVAPEKSQYEFLLCDFIRYCKSTNYINKISTKYTRTISNLFNDYILNWEQKNKTIEHNIDARGIENPNEGIRYDIGYGYIPDPITKSLCESNVLYKNIYKVLLASLRRGKDSKHCIYMSNKQVDDWNSIMKSIKIRTITI